MNLLTRVTRAAALRPGAIRLMRAIGRKGVRILLYHRFPDSARLSLERQCAYLRRYYHLVSLTEAAGWLKAGDPLPPNSLAVTVDDGYRDFFLNAYPVFHAYGIPVTVFLTTDFLDRLDWLWVDRIEYVFRQTRLRAAHIPVPPDGPTEFRLDSSEGRGRAISAVKAEAKRMSNQQRLKLIEDLADLLNVGWPEELPENYQPLRWDEVREMAAQGVDFGAHTKTHPILSSLSDRRERFEEINGSKVRIEQELGAPVVHFSYPNGMWRDMELETVDIVKKGGFRTAVVAQGGVNFRNADPYLLRRNTVEPGLSEALFGRYVTGFRRN